MRKLFVVFFLAYICFGGTVTRAQASDCSKEAMRDTWGDRFHTILKWGNEKKRILAERKADRVRACEELNPEKKIEALRDSLDCSEESLKNPLPDAVITFGKEGAEKDKILAEWKADPALACAKLKAERAAEDVRKSSEKLPDQLGL